MGIHRGWKKTEICHIEEKCYFNEGREMKEGGIDGSMWDVLTQRRKGAENRREVLYVRE